ncbi:hypothetical protein [Acinetobacter sp. ANC 4648]|uniref:hypothetical protein n=1 Tax=Acinetobacter sp. ANC 4648 TaxID=1977875 RepID=UPI000A3425CD|nr:hypothetical protein [Acinetobacter sp. ANC 4648]OTG82915.1 hypothetical protein B9T27_06490 [Acinetobacter sp. ANC 4648]
MNFKFIFATLIIAPLALTACSKQEKAPASEQTTAATDAAMVTPEQQAVIDTIDKPVLDEKNTDVSAEKANAATDLATPATEVEASKAQ